MEAHTCIYGREVAYRTAHNELSAVDWSLKTSQSQYALYGIERHAAYEQWYA